MSRVGLIAVVALLAVHPGDRAAHSATRRQTPVVLWAWERREDLRFIAPATASVAYLAGTVRLRGETVAVRPRLQALILPRGTTREPVVRIETDHQTRPVLSAPQRRQTVDAIIHLAHADAGSELQIDFDAAVSERAFYRALLAALRDQLPSSARLSITALASWCYGDDWLEGLPIDEAVPMLFRMGSDDATVRRRLAAGIDFRSPLCRHSVGVAVDEPLPFVPTDRRLYLFAPQAWSAANYLAATAPAPRSR